MCLLSLVRPVLRPCAPLKANEVGEAVRPLHTKRQRQLMAMFPSILGVMQHIATLSVHKPITFTHGQHWRHYAGPTLR